MKKNIRILIPLQMSTLSPYPQTRNYTSWESHCGLNNQIFIIINWTKVPVSLPNRATNILNSCTCLIIPSVYHNVWGFCCCCLAISEVAHADLNLTIYPQIMVNYWSSYSYISGSRISEVHYCAWFMWHWGLNLGLHIC